MGNQVWISVRPMLIPHNPQVNTLCLLIVTLKPQAFFFFFLMMYMLAGGKASENKKI